MKELDYPPNFWGRVYWDFHDFPKKFWGLGAPPPMGPGTPKCLILAIWRVPAPIRGGAPRPQIFFGKSRKSQQTLPQKLGRQSNSFMDFFEPKCLDQNRQSIEHRVKLRPAWWDSKSKNFLKIFHLVKSLGLNEWEKSKSQCF